MLPLGAALVGGAAATLAARRHIFHPVAHIVTGEQRRALYPPEKAVSISAQETLAADGIQSRREMMTLSNGTQMFSQVMSLKDRVPTHILVYFHGFTAHGDLNIEPMLKFVRQGALVVVPDLPCHGRSDGILAHIPDWFAFVDEIWLYLDQVVPPLAAGAASAGKPLMVFGAGCSLGGGLMTCMAVQRPTFFRGIALICPMLFVSEELKPPMIVTQVFKHLIKPLLPQWPLTPIKDLDGLDFRVQEQGRRLNKVNPMSMQGLKPRLATGCELGCTFPEWMALNLTNLRTPFLIMHGNKDFITDAGLSQRLFDEASATDKAIKIYDGAHHGELICCLPGLGRDIGMEFLPEQFATTETCLSDMAEWIGARL